MRTLPAFLTFFFLLSCCSSPNQESTKDRRVEQLLGPAVQVFVGDTWAGSGIVVSTDDDGSFIMTAHHVISDRLTRGAPISVSFETADGLKKGAASVLTWNEAADVAVLGTSLVAAHAAEVHYGDVDLFSKCYAVGISPFEIPLCNQGEVLGAQNGRYYVDAHMCFGYSGGGLFVEIDGDWKLVGVLVGVGAVGPYPLFHLGVVVDIRTALDALETPPLR